MMIELSKFPSFFFKSLFEEKKNVDIPSNLIWKTTKQKLPRQLSTTLLYINIFIL